MRRIMLTGAYQGDLMAENSSSSPANDLAIAIAQGSLTVQELTSLYCRKLFERFGSYGEVARRTGLDWRTVKKYVGEGLKG